MNPMDSYRDRYGACLGLGHDPWSILRSCLERQWQLAKIDPGVYKSKQHIQLINIRSRRIKDVTKKAHNLGTVL